jgi:hypothetical protein
MINRILVIHYDNKNRGITRLSITQKNTIDWLNIYNGKLCHHQEIDSASLKFSFVTPDNGIICRNKYQVSQLCFFFILNLVNPRFSLTMIIGLQTIALLAENIYCYLNNFINYNCTNRTTSGFDNMYKCRCEPKIYSSSL